MTENYAYTPSIWPSFFSILLLIALAVYSGRRRSVPGARRFDRLLVWRCVGSWLHPGIRRRGYGNQDLLVQVPEGLAAASRHRHHLLFLEYAWPGRWLTRRNLVLLSIPCLLILGLILTNNLHHLLWRGFAYDGELFPLRPGQLDIFRLCLWVSM